MAKLGSCIGTGSSCEVYEWGDEADVAVDKVVKLYHSHASQDEVDREFRNCLAAWENGLPAARPFKQILWEGRHGIVFEKVVGPTLVQRLFERLHAFDLFSDDSSDELIQFARTLHAIHQAGEIGGIVTEQKSHLKEIIARPVGLSDEEIAALHAYIDGLPAKRQVCHGDTNVTNLILSDRGPIMIDWMHAAIGNPAMDAAEFCVTILYAVLPPEMPSEVHAFFNASRQTIYRTFIDEYTRLTGVTEATIEPWHAVAAARQLTSGAVGEEQAAAMAAMIREKLRLTVV
ncbi:aminoglycoside phosphotransferase family protein [Paenibacillus sp. CCS19]|uniref:phosphotransferase family protein n=1 Tax=Paenibacillus sp. CCS19 TaxID=3158387 RepID=UPI00295E2A40|nr:aminoglycoside phosphotransferase family protein [Paenibacillus cellulosilyticus]